MAEEILQWDYQTFHLINQQWINPFFDFLFSLLRNKYFWAPFYGFLLAFLIVNFKGKGLIAIAFALATVVITDQVAATLIKPYVGRPRPCQEIALQGEVRLLVNCGSGKSFPSAHAANHFGVAFFLITILTSRFKWAYVLLLLWASSVAYAQVYVGVHFPIDVIAGAILGFFAGTWMGYLLRVLFRFRIE